MTNYNDTFSVLTGGGADSLDGIAVATLNDGDFAFGMINGLYHPYHYVAASTESEASPYFIVPNDNSSGTGVWVLGGFKGAMSHVLATESVTSLANATWTTIAHPTEEHDALSEYNNSTGVFTAKYDGYYQVCFCSQVTNSSWPNDSTSLIHRIQVEAVDIIKGPNITTQVGPLSWAATLSTSAVIEVSSGEELTCDAYQNSTLTKALNGTAYNWLTIDRIV